MGATGVISIQPTHRGGAVSGPRVSNAWIPLYTAPLVRLIGEQKKSGVGDATQWTRKNRNNTSRNEAEHTGRRSHTVQLHVVPPITYRNTHPALRVQLRTPASATIWQVTVFESLPSPAPRRAAAQRRILLQRSSLASKSEHKNEHYNLADKLRNVMEHGRWHKEEKQCPPGGDSRSSMVLWSAVRLPRVNEQTGKEGNYILLPETRTQVSRALPGADTTTLSGVAVNASWRGKHWCASLFQGLTVTQNPQAAASWGYAPASPRPGRFRGMR